jgi:hypothetical protein
MPTPAPSKLRVLVAGVDKDARGPVEAAVRRAFAGRDADGSWAVSLVRLGSSWSVTLSGPSEQFKHVSFVAEQHRLEEAIREASGGEASAPVATASPGASMAAASAPSGRIEDRHVCEKCQKDIWIRYEGRPDEPKELAPVACPHCWAVIHVEIGSWAVVGGDYSADKV